MYLLAVKPRKCADFLFFSSYPLLIGSRRFQLLTQTWAVDTLASGTQRWRPDFHGSVKSVNAKASSLSEARRCCEGRTAGLITGSPTWRGQLEAPANNPSIQAELRNVHFAGGVWCRATSGEHAKEARVGASHGRLTGGLFVLTSFVFALSNALCTLRR